ncbi:MAG: PEP-CTERM sorting domain-containing protein [Planctomycetaceae bacterium]|nr:PEP-CTERM sorting domain-containing protein [Planctomycetaceae bacterium]
MNRTTEQQNNRTTEQQNNRTTEQQNNRTTLKYVLVLAIAALCSANAAAKAETLLTDPAGSSQWIFEHFSNVDTYWDETKVTQTFRLADTDSHFTSFSLDLNAVVDVWWKIYNTIATTIQVPDNVNVYARFGGYLEVNGKNLGTLGYGTEGLTFDASELVFSGGYNKDVFDATGEAAFTGHIDVDLSSISETNELTFTWKVDSANFFDFFPLLEEQAGYTHFDYCAQWLWDVNGVFDVAYDSARNADVQTPEPATLLIVGLGIAGAAVARRYRKK